MSKETTFYHDLNTAKEKIMSKATKFYYNLTMDIKGDADKAGVIADRIKNAVDEVLNDEFEDYEELLDLHIFLDESRDCSDEYVNQED